ncbi:MAG: hypothetical protein A4E29_01458 [Methanomassiliicoccales archaeon PtaB.Bin134]|nr:MAG: hypothetical protein A4E29_01458 [Methanomassiliicoccales archaeon PtaB.Bin134]
MARSLIPNGHMYRDYAIWVDIASRKRACHRCRGTIVRGAMFVRLGSKERPRGAASLCAECFNAIMVDMTEGFIELKKSAVPVAGKRSGEDKPRCPACGLETEKCRCGWEAYR